MKTITTFPGIKVYHSGILHGAVCLPGIGIFINEKQYSNRFLDYVLQHEYGHYLDFKFAKDLRPFPLLLFYLKIGIPSFLNALTGIGGEHRLFWTERRANRRAVLFFGDNLKKDFIKHFPV